MAERGVVLLTQGDGTALIALRDWGQVIERPYCEIYQLEDKFRELK